MESLADLYKDIVSQDEVIEKEAAEAAVAELAGDGDGDDDGVVKMAQEYDAAGRIMARAFMSEMVKEAVPKDEEQNEGEEDKGEKDDKDKDKDKDKKKKKFPPGMEAMMAEKKAALKQRMQEDPEFARQMVERYGQ